MPRRLPQLARAAAGLLFAPVLLAPLLLAPAVLCAQAPVPCTGPLTETGIIKLAANGVPEPRLVLIVKTCGADFPLTREAEGRLRAAGASDAVIDALREVAPKPKPPRAAPPAKAETPKESEPPRVAPRDAAPQPAK